LPLATVALFAHSLELYITKGEEVGGSPDSSFVLIEASIEQLKANSMNILYRYFTHLYYKIGGAVVKADCPWC
jgi:hypothetical protein